MCNSMFDEGASPNCNANAMFYGTTVAFRWLTKVASATSFLKSVDGAA